MSFGVGYGDLDGLVDRLVDPLRVLGAAVNLVLDQNPAELSPGEKGPDLIRLRRHIDRLEAAFARRAQDASRNGVGAEDGYVSCPAWIRWKTGMRRGAVTNVLRNADLVELLPETGAAWRDGKITTTAVAMIAAARVAGCDEDLAAMEPEFLDRARRGDHESLKILTRHFKACARADGSKPELPDG